MLTNIRIIWKRYLNEAEEDRFWDMPNWQRNLRREVQFARHCKQGPFPGRTGSGGTSVVSNAKATFQHG